MKAKTYDKLAKGFFYITFLIMVWTIIDVFNVRAFIKGNGIIYLMSAIFATCTLGIFCVYKSDKKTTQENKEDKE